MTRRMHTSALLFIFMFGGLVAGLPAQAQPKPPARGIVRITGELYRAQNDNHYTVFLVTPEGVIMSDPINRDFARWLKGEIATRFKVPVRYVLYTHHDWDHASGGVVFADTAEFVGHQNMPAALALPAGNLPLPANAAKLDANGNGLVERREATGQTADQFALIDANRDMVLSGAELARGPLSDVYLPTTMFADRHTVTLGGKRVEMVYLGDAHAPDSTAIYFPAERTVFSADVMQVRRLPGGLAPTAGAWQEALRRVLALDFEHAATGHALAGTRKDIEALYQYVQDITTAVAAEVAAGRSLAETQKRVTLPAYKGWERYDTNLTSHVAQVYETLRGVDRGAR